MSLLNAYVTAERALVAVDTASMIGGRMSAVSKAFALPQLPAVLAGRGSLATLAALVGYLATCQSFEDAAAWLDDNLASVRTGLQQALRASGVDPELQLEVVLVGYSATSQRMLGTAWLREDGEEFRSYEITDGFSWIAPWADDEQGEPIIPETPTRAIELMRAQARDAAGRFPRAVAGGRAVIFELTPLGINIALGDPLA